MTSTKLLDNYGKDIKNVLDPTLITGSSINGKLYAVPVNKEAAYQWGYAFNKTFVDKYKLDTSNVKTVADAEAMFKVIKQNESDVIPLAVGGNAGTINLLPYDPIVSQTFPVAMNVINNTKKMINMYESDDVKNLFKTMNSFYKAGYIPKDAATTKSYTDKQKSGKVFATLITYTPDLELNFPALYGYSAVYCPLQTPTIAGTAGTGAMQAISTTSEDKERTMMFLNLLYSDKTLINMLDYGIENQHYVKKGDNVADLPSGVTASTNGYTANKWTVGNEFLSYLVPIDKSDKWDKYKKFNTTAVKSPALGFNFDNSKVSSQVAQINTVVSEYYPSLMSGAVDPDVYLPQFNSKLKSAGVEDVIKEAQTQYDTWTAIKK